MLGALLHAVNDGRVDVGARSGGQAERTEGGGGLVCNRSTRRDIVVGGRGHRARTSVHVGLGRGGAAEFTLDVVDKPPRGDPDGHAIGAALRQVPTRQKRDDDAVGRERQRGAKGGKGVEEGHVGEELGENRARVDIIQETANGRANEGAEGPREVHVTKALRLRFGGRHLKNIRFSDRNTRADRPVEDADEQQLPEAGREAKH